MVSTAALKSCGYYFFIWLQLLPKGFAFHPLSPERQTSGPVGCRGTTSGAKTSLLRQGPIAWWRSVGGSRRCLHRSSSKYDPCLLSAVGSSHFSDDNNDKVVQSVLDADLVEVPLPITILPPELSDRINTLVNQRAKSRWDGKYKEADELLEKLDAEVLLPHPSMGLVVEDFPRRLGGGSSWKLKMDLQHESLFTATQPVDNIAIPSLRRRTSDSVLNLAHAALGMRVSASELHYGRLSEIDSSAMRHIVSQAKSQLGNWYKVHQNTMVPNNHNNKTVVSLSDDEKRRDPALLLHQFLLGETESSLEQGGVTMDERISQCISVETRLRGRKAADAAFWFALAGVNDNELYELLTEVTIKEMVRFGERPSCRVLDLMAMVDRLAAAGIRNNSKLESTIQSIVDSKSREKDNNLGKEAKYFSANDNFANLHSDNCLFMLWKFSARQRKQKAFLETAADHWESTKKQASNDFSDCPTTVLGTSPFATPDHSFYDWDTIYGNSSRPLVIDVGCGMGVSLLGLASLSDKSNHIGDTQMQQDWSLCNFLGVDLSALAIGYARNIAQRWDLADRLHFALDDSSRLLQAVADSYPGPVVWVLIQFPTPYRLAALAPAIENPSEATPSGNSQLPQSAADGFMVTPELLKLANTLLHPSNTKSSPTGGRVILQSNCEDVAIYMREMACQSGLFSVVESTNTRQRRLPGIRRNGVCHGWPWVDNKPLDLVGGPHQSSHV